MTLAGNGVVGSSHPSTCSPIERQLSLCRPN
jgi:hypothetical protein